MLLEHFVAASMIALFFLAGSWVFETITARWLEPPFTTLVKTGEQLIYVIIFFGFAFLLVREIFKNDGDLVLA